MPWTVACQALLSMRFSRQEHWSGLPFPSPGDLPNPGIKPRSPALQADSLPTELRGKPIFSLTKRKSNQLTHQTENKSTGLDSPGVQQWLRFTLGFLGNTLPIQIFGKSTTHMGKLPCFTKSLLRIFTRRRSLDGKEFFPYNSKEKNQKIH